MSNIYQVIKEHASIINDIIDAGGEITPEQEQSLAISEKAVWQKSESYCMGVKQILSEVDIIDAEIERLKKIKESRLKVTEYLKNTVKNAMELLEIEKIETPVLKISFRKSESVEITNEEMIPEAFIKEKVTKTVDKIYIKQAIQSGAEVPGAILKINNNLIIK